MQAIYVNIKTVLLILGFLTFLVQNTTAQNGEYGWRVGFGTGFMDYYGDITSESYKKSLKNHYKNAIDFDANRGLSYMVTVERRPDLPLLLRVQKAYLLPATAPTPKVCTMPVHSTSKLN
ncbi:MAG TPA: hypothetical protein PKD56_05895 [Chitinophagales bacterium]|nr:hypothetical protein [Chitinophagales bacterium]